MSPLFRIKRWIGDHLILGLAFSTWLVAPGIWAPMCC